MIRSRRKVRQIVVGSLVKPKSCNMFGMAVTKIQPVKPSRFFNIVTFDHQPVGIVIAVIDDLAIVMWASMPVWTKVIKNQGGGGTIVVHELVDLVGIGTPDGC